MASALYGRGHRIVMADIDEEGLNRAALAHGWSDGERAELALLDVRDADAWERLVERTTARWGKLDVLMNIAGYLVPKWAKDARQKDVDMTIDVNVKGVMFGTNAAVRTMTAARHGHIVNIASIAGLVPVPGLAIYSASKYAVRAYSLAVAQEVRRHGVYVTAVCPALVATPMMTKQIDHEETAFVFASGRPLTTDEVVDAVIERALVKKPMELVLPTPGSGQGMLAKLVNVFPELGLRTAKSVTRRGLAEQGRHRRSN
jgi:3-oxoacyl-[acyl-carrier protein] reductase